MNKIVKWNVGGTILWFIFSFIIVLASVNISDLSLYVVDPKYYTGGIILVITGIVSLVMMYHLFNRYRAHRVVITEILMGLFLMTSLLAFLQAFFSFWRFYIPTEPGLTSDQYIFQQYWFNSSYYFLSSAIIGMGQFIYEVFYNGFKDPKNWRKFQWFWGYAIFFNGFLLKYTLFGANDIEFGILAGIFVLLGFYIFGQLAVQSLRLRQRIDKGPEREGLRYIALSGIAIIGGVLSTFVFNIFWESGTEVIFLFDLSNILFLVSYVALFWGFVLPLRNKSQ